VDEVAVVVAGAGLRAGIGKEVNVIAGRNVDFHTKHPNHVLVLAADLSLESD